MGGLAHELGVSPAALLIAWVVGRSPVTLPLAGTRSLTHLRENLASLSVELPAHALARLDALSERVEALPPLSH